MGKPPPSWNPLLGHVPALDGLRGIAILAVMAIHFIPGRIPGGFLGVDLFFVLSGFLITTLLCRERDAAGTLSLKRFYYRRALRLFPGLAVLLLVCCVAPPLFCSPDVARENRKAAGAALLYFSNWRSIWSSLQQNPLLPWNAVIHTWSLSIEEQFYIVWPLLLGGLLWLRVRRGFILLIAVLGILAVGMVRALLFERWGTVLYLRTDTHCDGLLIGCVVGLFYAWNMLPKSSLALLAVRVAAPAALLTLTWQFVKITFVSRFLYQGGFSLISLEVALVLLGVLVGPPKLLSWILEFPPLGWLGRISYGLYLWHLPVFLAYPFLFASWVPHAGRLFIIAGLSLLAGAGSYYLIERPFLRLKHPAASLRVPPSSPDARFTLARSAA